MLQGEMCHLGFCIFTRVYVNLQKIHRLFSLDFMIKGECSSFAMVVSETYFTPIYTEAQFWNNVPDPTEIERGRSDAISTAYAASHNENGANNTAPQATGGTETAEVGYISLLGTCPCTLSYLVLCGSFGLFSWSFLISRSFVLPSESTVEIKQRNPNWPEAEKFWGEHSSCGKNAISV